jgi:hypothetical protein
MGFLSDFFNALKGGSKEADYGDINKKLYEAQREADKGNIRRAEELAEQWEKETGRKQ